MAAAQRLFDIQSAETQGASASPHGKSARDEPGSRIVRVLPDVAGFDKVFDYVVPQSLAASVEIGTLVSVRLKSRRVDAWVLEVDVTENANLELRPIERILSMGPPAEVVDLATWASLRWAGRRRAILRTASPSKRVSHWPASSKKKPLREPAYLDPQTDRRNASVQKLVASVLAGPPVAGVVTGAAQATAELLLPMISPNSLVVVPTVARARYLAGQLSRAGFRTHLYPREWAGGRRGGVVVGQRSSVWAPLAAEVKTIVVIDEHDEALQEERNPTWNARDVAIERSRRRGGRCLLLSPCLSLAARTQVDRVFELPRSSQRSSWPIVDVVDRRDEEPNRYGLFSPAVVNALRAAASGVAILNRKGRSVMLSCRTCGELVRTVDGERLMVEQDGALLCRATGESRPMVCAFCAGTTLRRLRLGISRAAEELSALLGEPVAEVGNKGSLTNHSRVSIGTEAALYQQQSADVVAFLDFDQELLAPRYRASEQAMALLVRAARLTGGRDNHPRGRLIVQTRTPEHRVLGAALRADPSRFVEAELALRKDLLLPPYTALAELSGEGAAALASSIGQFVGSNADNWSDVAVIGPRSDEKYLLRVGDAARLAELLDLVGRPAARVRVSVDPSRA